MDLALASATLLGGLAAAWFFRDKVIEMRNQPFHPPGTETARGNLIPCRVHIHPNYATTKGWGENADVLVEIDHPLGAGEGNIYLIPSGAVNPDLRHTGAFRKDEFLVERKRRLTEDFVHRYRKRRLRGVCFVIETRHGKRVKVYSPAYDRFLSRASGK